MNLELVTLLYYRDIGYTRKCIWSGQKSRTDFSSEITYPFRDKLSFIGGCLLSFEKSAFDSIF